MLDRAVFREWIKRQLVYVEGKAPITGAMLAALDADLAAGEPAWFGRLRDVWKGRVFGPYYEALGLLLAALHREALAGRAPALARCFPTCGGSESGAGPAAVEFLRQAPAAFFEGLAGERLQTNEAARSVAWLLPACAGFLSRASPFHLVELGTSAGLLLIGDYLQRTVPLLLADGQPAGEPDRWRDTPYPVLSRHGLDARPRRLAEPLDRQWIKACIWPHDLERLVRFEQAADLFLRLSRELTGPKLHEATFARMPEWIASTIQPHAEEGLLVFNAQAADFLSQPDYEALERSIGEVLKPWKDRGLWIELEFPRGGNSEQHELRAHRWVDGRFQSRVLGRTDAHAKGLRLEPGWDFLRPLEPVTVPRNTREEPIKNLEPGIVRFIKGA